jgi:uncharacterized protein
MGRTGYADLPLHYGRVPAWLAERMSSLGGAIVEAIVMEYGRNEVLTRLSDPLWFQSLGCVLGMDWHSSGITTSVMGALKKSVNPKAKELGIFICGGRGKHSRQTPDELIKVASRTGLNGDMLVRSSKLAAKVDNTAIQDGFQLYLHNFIVTSDGHWSIIQQGMNGSSGMARRYHWLSQNVRTFIDAPHTGITGENQGLILNLADSEAESTRKCIVELSHEHPEKMIAEARKILMPRHHEVRSSDVNMKRLGAILTVAHEMQFANFEDLLLLEGVGPRAVQSLALVSEVIYGSPVRFNDPARFSFAHGGKDGHPFPVPLKVYDETISVLRNSIDKARIDGSEKLKALKKLSEISLSVEKNFIPNDFLEDVIAKERATSYLHGGKTVFGDAKPPRPAQLKLF